MGVVALQLSCSLGCLLPTPEYWHKSPLPCLPSSCLLIYKGAVDDGPGTDDLDTYLEDSAFMAPGTQPAVGIWGIWGICVKFVLPGFFFSSDSVLIFNVCFLLPLLL